MLIYSEKGGIIRLFIILFLIFINPAISLAESTYNTKGYYHIKAESVSYLNNSDTYILTNGVIKRKNLSISADSIIINKTTNILKASVPHDDNL